MAEEKKAAAKAAEKTTGKRVLRGIVTSDKMQDTVVVAVTRYEKHPKYKKYMKSVKKYHAHDAGNNFKIGDKVSIQETKPFSKLKRYEVITKK